MIKKILLVSLLSTSAFANSVSQICPYAKDTLSITVDDTTLHIGQPIAVHYTAALDLHYVYAGANTIDIERHKCFGDSCEMVKIRRTVPPNGYIRLHEDNFLQYPAVSQPGQYLVSYRVYVPARDCNLRGSIMLVVQ